MSDTLRFVLQNTMLLGAIQGIIFTAIVLVSKKYKSKSSLFLALLILCFSLNNIQYYLWETGIVDGDFFFGAIYFPYASLSMVLYYFYVKWFLYPTHPFTKKQWLLLLPCFVFFVLTVYYKIGNATGMLSDSTILFFGRLIYIHEIFSVLWSLILLGITYRLIWKFGKQQQFQKTQTPRLELNWLKIISALSFVLCIVWIISIYDELKNNNEEIIFYYILWIGMSFTIYILGHIGIYRFGILQEQKKIREYSENNAVVLAPKKIGNAKNKNILEFENFIIQKKNYLDNNLSLDKVAEKLDLNKSYLSRIINAELGKSFTDYVNELRVAEAKSYMENPDFTSYTLVAIGLEAGFNSKTTFNNAFKKVTGITPSEYRKNLYKNT